MNLKHVERHNSEKIKVIKLKTRVVYYKGKYLTKNP